MATSEHISAILRENKIDPDAKMKNDQTAFQFLEAAILGALDSIEEETEG